MCARVALIVLLAACTTCMAETATRPDCRYLGKTRTPAWIDQQYRRFADKITAVDGKARLVGKEQLELRMISTTPPEVGDWRIPTALSDIRGRQALPKILQVIEPNEAIVARPGLAAKIGLPGQDEVLFHVKGIDPKRVVDGTPFNEPLVYLGNYSYTSVAGATRTIQSYRLHHSLSREEFLQALAGGLELVDYRVVTRTKKVGIVVAGRQSFRTEKVDEIVGTPVR